MGDEKETAYAPFVDYEVKDDSTSKDYGIVEGYASVFGKKDSGGDTVFPGAFTKTLEQRSHRIMYLPSHDYRIHVKDIPAVPISIKEDAKGLHTVTKFLLDTVAGKDSFAVIKAYQNAGIPLGLSYTFKPTEQERTSGGRNLKQVDLYEYGHTALPMLDDARTVSAKNDDPDKKDISSNSMMHSDEIDHPHNHGDLIHNHPHTHSKSSYGEMSGHYSHDHTADQMKSLVPNEEMELKRYSIEQRQEMAKKGQAQEDLSWPLATKEDVIVAVKCWELSGSSAKDKSWIIKRAKDLECLDDIPGSWKSMIHVISERKAEDLIKEFETQLGRNLDEHASSVIKKALGTITETLGQEQERQENTVDPDAKMKQEIDEMLAKMSI